jgi:hypothetical protein
MPGKNRCHTHPAGFREGSSGMEYFAAEFDLTLLTLVINYALLVLLLVLD